VTFVSKFLEIYAEHSAQILFFFFFLMFSVLREPRVLTGRSLQCLAREVPAGINLAVHLDISESTITGMAFDALASGPPVGRHHLPYPSAVEAGGRRRRPWASDTACRADAAGAAQVEALATAIDAVGFPQVAEVVRERHRANKELTSDCFHPESADDDAANHVTINSLADAFA
jgi:hypothetical protein